MGMAEPRKEPKWDEAHIEEVKMVYVVYDLPTSSLGRRIGPAPSIWVCKDCRRSRQLCCCAWRKS